MTRGLPFSLLVHVLFLVVVVVYGNHVTRPPLQHMQAIPFRMVHEKALVAKVDVEVPDLAHEPEVAEPKPDPVVQKDEPVQPPKEVPVEPPQAKQPVEKVTPPDQQDPAEVAETEPEEVASPATFIGGPQVDATDTDFPFAWYLARVEGLIDRNWNPRQLGFGKHPLITCSVHFEIARNGLVSGASLTVSSGIGVYDRDALRAVSTTRLPPLPPQYPSSRLGVTFIFNLEPES